jgi:glycosyltransferase involved in cell wall biosynthesis
MVSVVIIAWNEAKRLPRLLGSVDGLASEVVVVVDEATTDDTVKIAKKHGCKVFSHPHVGYVEPMRNFAISKAKYDWVLLLDADEEISPKLKSEILSFIAKPTHDIVRIPRKNIIFKKWIKSSHWWPDYVSRLFKKGTLIWSNEIHSQPVVNGLCTDLPADEDLSIIHSNYSTIDEYLEQISRYTVHQKDVLIKKGYRFLWSDLLVKPANEFLSQYFSRQGFKDGLHGLSLSLLQAFSELVLYLRVWEQETFLDQPITVSELSQTVSRINKDFSWWKGQIKSASAKFPLDLLLKVKSKIFA